MRGTTGRMNSLAVILPAAGKGSRFLAESAPTSGSMSRFSVKKPFVRLGGDPVWLWSVKVFSSIPETSQILLVVAPEDVEAVRREYVTELTRFGVEVVPGGEERFLSVENGLRRVRDGIDYVAIHDAARPCVTRENLLAVLEVAIRTGAAIPAVPIFGTIKRTTPDEMDHVEGTERGEETTGGKDGLTGDRPLSYRIETTVPRERLWEAQTPQIFAKRLYEEGVRKRGDFSPTDDAGLLERLGIPVHLVPGERTNLKITTAFDLALAEKYLEIREESFRGGGGREAGKDEENDRSDNRGE